MLVLSRRLNEKLLFPGLKTAIEILAIKSGVVRLGIDAPRSVKVLREEVPDRSAEWGTQDIPPADMTVKSRLRELNHLIRNRLNCANLGLAVISRQLEAGLARDAQSTLAKVSEDFQMLVARLDGEKQELQSPRKARKSKALVVEDNRNECELLATFLRMAEVEVDTAYDGADALDYLKTRDKPDVVLLDMSLPRCDGPTMLRAIRRDPDLAGIKVFAVTGHTPDEYGISVGPGGVDRWISKPLDPVALLRDLNWS
jgi:carbon storage regulator CsrA